MFFVIILYFMKLVNKANQCGQKYFSYFLSKKKKN